jgi:uncharacterized pyridoxal phosphate-containing UPF0001 family protein
MIQVDTSGEITKSGVDFDEMIELIKYIKSDCIIYIIGIIINNIFHIVIIIIIILNR